MQGAKEMGNELRSIPLFEFLLLCYTNARKVVSELSNFYAMTSRFRERVLWLIGWVIYKSSSQYGRCLPSSLPLLDANRRLLISVRCSNSQKYVCLRCWGLAA